MSAFTLTSGVNFLCRVTLFCVMVTSEMAIARAQIVISNFSTENPLTFADGGSSWASPVNQFESFTSGSITGQEIVSIQGGNPTVSGGAGNMDLNLNLAGATGLDLTLRLLPDNQASVIQVLLFDSDNTILRLDFDASKFNTSTFTTSYSSFAQGITAYPGSVSGFNLSHVKVYEVQGDFYDGTTIGTALFGAQFSKVTAVVAAPEPSLWGVLAAFIAITSAFAWLDNKKRFVG